MRIEGRSWQEFQETGLLWWVNRGPHLFGWAIVLETDGATVVTAYPARVPYRGFDRADEEDGFRRVSRYMERESKVIREEADRE